MHPASRQRFRLSGGTELSFRQALPSMEAHVLDAGHKLLETHGAAAVSLMLDFIEGMNVKRRNESACVTAQSIARQVNGNLVIGL